MRHRFSGFDRRGVFNCHNCGRLTRGVSTESTMLCGECSEWCAAENQHSDDAHSPSKPLHSCPVCQSIKDCMVCDVPYQLVGAFWLGDKHVLLCQDCVSTALAGTSPSEVIPIKPIDLVARILVYNFNRSSGNA